MRCQSFSEQGGNALSLNRSLARSGAAALLALVMLSQAPGAWIAVPLEEHVRTSNWIVVGTLGEWSYWRRDYDATTLKVEEVLWGKNVPAELRVRIYTDVINTGRAVKYRHPTRPTKVWLLVRGSRRDKAYVSHPGCQRSLDEKREVVQLLEKMPVFARDALGKPRRLTDPYVELVFRNVSQKAVEIPRFTLSRNRLKLAAGAKLTLTKLLPDRTEVEVPPIPGAIVTEEKQPTITVPARGEYKVAFKASRIYTLEKEQPYRLKFELKGFPSVGGPDRMHLYVPDRKRRKR